MSAPIGDSGRDPFLALCAEMARLEAKSAEVTAPWHGIRAELVRDYGDIPHTCLPKSDPRVTAARAVFAADKRIGDAMLRVRGRMLRTRPSTAEGLLRKLREALELIGRVDERQDADTAFAAAAIRDAIAMLDGGGMKGEPVQAGGA